MTDLQDIYGDGGNRTRERFLPNRTYLRPLTPAEHAQMRENGWTCSRCEEPATERIVGPGAFRLCQTHAQEIRDRLEALSNA